MSEPKEATRTSALPWLLGQTGEQKSRYLASVLVAVLGVASRVAPYFVVANVISHLMAGERDVGYYLRQCGLIAVFWALQVVFHAISTAISHKATFAVLGDIRKRCTDKLARMPLGDVLDQPSGALKSTIVERIDAMETTLAHIVPEFTSNLLAPICLLICLFAADWRMALAALVTVPLGMVCYMGMMVGYEPNYQRTIRATRALNDVAVEYIHGIEVIKVFGKAESSYQRFVEAAREGAASYVDWMRKCNLYFTFGILEFFKKTSSTMLACFVGFLAFSITLFAAVVLGWTPLPRWACIFNVLPIFLVMAPFRIVGTLNLAGALMFAGLFFLI